MAGRPTRFGALIMVRASIALKPGGVLGPYPERTSQHIGRLDVVAQRLVAPLVSRWSSYRSRSRGFLAMVDDAGSTLICRSDKRLLEQAHELRSGLHRQGLTEDLTAAAFALVREVAYRKLGMRHYDSQIRGGKVMLDGMLAEMETGEGKTLTATLPACVAAMAGIPVHIITVNDYLVTRDAALMTPVYSMLGLTVGTVTEENSDPESRREAYAKDITYCTNKQVAFDYLRDRLTLGTGRGPIRHRLDRLQTKADSTHGLILRGLCFAIVDEADSVLIDEARTPLILSGPSDRQHEPQVYRQALDLASTLEADKGEFVVSQAQSIVSLTTAGRQRLTELTEELADLWQSPRRREELVVNALVATHLRVLDRHYLVRDGAVQIIDENTGRVMADRCWQAGIQQMVELKEGCEITAQRESLARLTYQRFFRRYMRLGAMTGTAMEAAGELSSVYGLRVVRISSHKPLRRVCVSRRVWATEDIKWAEVISRAKELQQKQRPVLIGTRSVEASERLSERLTAADLTHQVLNARHDLEEAKIIANAGWAGRITVATNMAGRGTDIKIAPGVAALGGLHVIATERNEAKRIDRQLFGRCGRQGDPGSFEEILSY
ncbi:MAG: prepilin peptidase, partial [Gammaproteobacteria bacterium]|nr:prepilin peptidase [Gammaproteobacteria bacterium]